MNFFTLVYLLKRMKKVNRNNKYNYLRRHIKITHLTFDRIQTNIFIGQEITVCEPPKKHVYRKVC